jgi:peptidoglycan/LPS O-acetylase OafA/YrhL
MDHINPKIDALTSLRFFAAALIVIGHSKGLFGIPTGWLDRLPTDQGVTFFFVLSGFILTYVYPNIKNSADAHNFVIARVARIWPAHLATFLLSLVMYPWAPAILKTGYGQLAAVLNLALIQAWVPVQAIYFSFNAVSWSISVELFFYLNFIWLISNIETTWFRKLLFSLIGAVSMIILSRFLNVPLHGINPFGVDGDGLLYISPLSRIFEFVFGMSAAVAFQRLRRSVLLTGKLATAIEITLVVTVIALFFIEHSDWVKHGLPVRLLPIELRFWLVRSGAAPLYATMIVIFAFQSGVVSKKLSSSILVLLGEISYSIYLLHQILSVWVMSHPGLVGFIPPYVGYPLYLVATVLGSYAMWRFVERPCRAAITKRLIRRPVVRSAA